MNTGTDDIREVSVTIVLQRPRKRYACFAKQDPEFQTGLGRNFSQPHTSLFRGLCCSRIERRRKEVRVDAMGGRHGISLPM